MNLNSNCVREGDQSSAESDDISLISFFSDEELPLAHDHITMPESSFSAKTNTTRKVLGDLDGPKHFKRNRTRKTKSILVEKNTPLTLESLGNHALLQSAAFAMQDDQLRAKNCMKRQRSCDDAENCDENLPKNTITSRAADPSSYAKPRPVKNAVRSLQKPLVILHPGRHHCINELRPLTGSQLRAHFGLSEETCTYVSGLFTISNCTNYLWFKLWRQVSIELGIPVDILFYLCERRVFAIKYANSITEKMSTAEHVFSKHDDILIYGKVLAWEGSGRGLWEGLATRLGCTILQVMCRWAQLVSASDQHKWCRLAYSARLYRFNGGSNVRSSSTETSTIPATHPVYHRLRTDRSLSSLHHYANRYILQFIHQQVKQFNHTVHEGTEGVFWQFVSDEIGVCAHALEQLWQHMCSVHSDSCIFVPLIVDADIRRFTLTEDRYVIALVEYMSFRYGCVRWTNTSSYNYLHRCPYDMMHRWLYYLRFNLIGLYQHCYDVLYRLCDRYRVQWESTSAHGTEVKDCVMCMMGAVELRYVN